MFELVHRDFAPLAERLRAAIAREREIPAVLAAAKLNIEHPPRAFVEIAIRGIAGSINFYRDGAPKAFAAVADPELQRDFATSNDAAIAAFEDYKAFLESQLSKADGDFALQSAVFVERLTDNEMIALPVSKLHDIALRQLHQDQAALKAAAHEVDPAKSVGAVVEDIRRQHPNAATLLPTAEEDLSGLRAFVSEHRLVTIPSELLPTVEATPEFMRATIAAAMDAPGLRATCHAGFLLRLATRCRHVRRKARGLPSGLLLLRSATHFGARGLAGPFRAIPDATQSPAVVACAEAGACAIDH